MEIRLLDVAQDELDDAIEYYNQKSPGLGDQFLLEVLSALERIKRFPEAWHPFTENSRRCQIRRFSYGLAYQILDSEILIVAIAKPTPKTWLLVGPDDQSRKVMSRFTLASRARTVFPAFLSPDHRN